MRHSTRSSNVSAPCRLEWRASRWVVTVLLLLGPLAALSLIASDAPRALAWSGAVLVCIAGLWNAHRESKQSPCWIVIAADGTATVNAEQVSDFDVVWRGPLAFLSWRDEAGRSMRKSFWPDTLPPAKRRELKLAARPLIDGPNASGMAH